MSGNRRIRHGANTMMGGWGMALGDWLPMAVWILVLVALVWVIVAGYRDRSGREDPIEILRARFARGDISEDEYEQARRVLLGQSRSTR